MGTDTVCDIKGYPIEPGDVLRTPHYKHGRRNMYLFHVAVQRRFGLYAEPAAWLSERKEGDGGSFLLLESTVQSTQAEIVQGLSEYRKQGLVQWFERKKPHPGGGAAD